MAKTRISNEKVAALVAAEQTQAKKEKIPDWPKFGFKKVFNAEDLIVHPIFRGDRVTAVDWLIFSTAIEAREAFTKKFKKELEKLQELKHQKLL